MVTTWNVVSFLPPPAHLPVLEMASDTSGSWGCGAWHQLAWFQVCWDARSQNLPISVKEPIPILLASATWGRAWQGWQVICHCDNQAVLGCLNSRTSRQKDIMHLLRCLTFIEAWFYCFLHVYPKYINTKLNYLADDLS